MKKLLWPGILFVLIGASVLLHVVMIIVASADPSFAVDDRYNKSGETWQQTRDQQLENQRLGWTVDLKALQSTMPGMDAVLKATVRDRTGLPIEQARVTAVVFHHARAGNAWEVVLYETTGGQYAGAAPMQRPGLWSCQISVERGDERFTADLEQMILAPSKEPGE